LPACPTQFLYLPAQSNPIPLVASILKPNSFTCQHTQPNSFTCQHTRTHLLYLPAYPTQFLCLPAYPTQFLYLIPWLIALCNGTQSRLGFHLRRCSSGDTAVLYTARIRRAQNPNSNSLSQFDSTIALDEAKTKEFSASTFPYALMASTSFHKSGVGKKKLARTQQFYGA
jgi:hypothetical protein